MPADTVAALGTTLGYSADGTAYTDVGQLVSINHAGGGEVGERDTTVLSSTSKTTRPTIPDFGELTFELNWDATDATHNAIANAIGTPPAVDPYFKVTWSNAETTIIRGWVKNLDGPNAEGVDDNVKASVTVRVNGVTNS